MVADYSGENARRFTRQEDAMRDISVTRVVIKIGDQYPYAGMTGRSTPRTWTASPPGHELERMGVQSIIVTSGAIGSGSSELGLDDLQKDILHKQACAAVGQPP